MTRERDSHVETISQRELWERLLLYLSRYLEGYLIVFESWRVMYAWLGLHETQRLEVVNLER
jgi:hypothetical protein